MYYHLTQELNFQAIITKQLHFQIMKLKIPSLSIEMVVPRSRVVRSCSHDVYKMQVFVNE